eukprot:gnl/MRDRNA2_/MRDRNA2_20195_c0_seq2.p1 gnl/MRDRNA2_/MRDRNA2_20195_c0~~gnl/MRDRNA2_/MRDRNA2_20195_c0_seq2.p1  ORF type:complete len:326 (+),score=36.19 gnl/MRDRNA2_/MRDRNA2_20195_c0_seq2:17-994(+)
MGLSESKRCFEQDVLWFANGVCQAVPYPVIQGLLASRVSAESRGSIFGLWGTCQQGGGMLATFFATSVQQRLGWRYAFYLPSVWVLVVGCVTWISLQSVKTPSTTSRSSEERPGFFAVLRLPSVVPLGLSYFCIKLVRYIGIFWVPFFLTSIGEDPQVAAFLSTTFDVGGLFGGVLCGMLADAVSGRVIQVCQGMCVLSSVILSVYASWYSTFGLPGHALTLASLGLLVAGPDSHFGGSAITGVMHDAGLTDALPAAAGIINGLGALGTVFSGAIVAYVFGDGSHGSAVWGSLWMLLSNICVLPCLMLIPSVVAEHKRVSAAKRK